MSGPYNICMEYEPLEFSIVHPTARPKDFLTTRDKWMAAAWLGNYEYIACADYGAEGFSSKSAHPARLVWNYGTKCSNDATNVGCAAALGKVLVVISDDILPCDYWDLRLREIPELWGDKECVVRVKTGGTADDRGLLAVQIVNRKRYDRLGYLFHPAFVSMFGDDDFTEHAERDGVIVDAPHIVFPHHHWSTGQAEMDEVYRRQNAPERYTYGEAILRWRREHGFPRTMPEDVMEMRRGLD